MITARPFEPDSILEIINKHNVTAIIIVPSLLAKLLDSCERCHLRNDSLQFLCVGGQPLSKQMNERAKLAFPNSKVCTTYACSEGCMLSLNLSNIKCESAGQLYGNVEMKERKYLHTF